MKNFTDKVAVISGGANGIGLDIARCLAAEACHVVIADIDQTACDAAAAQITALGHGVKAVGMACDVTDKSQITGLANKAWEMFGQVDLLFNNAGVGAGLTPSVEMSDDDLRWIFEVNFFGNWHMCMEFFRRFAAQESDAHICNTASENSVGWPMPMMAGYNASKAAVLGYTGMLRMECPPHLSLSLLCPGWTQTEIGNSGPRRPAQFGGPKQAGQPFPTDGPHYPYPVETVGAHTLQQIKQGAFYIFPHYAARHLAAERNDEIIAAFDAQTSPSEDWKTHDTRSFFELMSGMKVSLTKPE
ncbi:MAG: SDR family NAD(P)-dependent oxidoreductase [Parvibaculales bacterium]